MTKTELMETYTAEQLAEEFIKAYNGDSINQIVVNVGGLPKIYPIKEIEDIVIAYEEIKICQEQNKQCKTILPAEYLKVLTLNQTVSELHSEVEKYRKAFEGEKNEHDCQIAEYQKKIEESKKKSDIYFPEEPIKVADLIISGWETSLDYKHFDISKLRQIAEHLLVYCNHNGEVEE